MRFALRSEVRPGAGPSRLSIWQCRSFRIRRYRPSSGLPGICPVYWSGWDNGWFWYGHRIVWTWLHIPSRSATCRSNWHPGRNHKSSSPYCSFWALPGQGYKAIRGPDLPYRASCGCNSRTNRSDGCWKLRSRTRYSSCGHVPIPKTNW